MKVRSIGTKKYHKKLMKEVGIKNYRGESPLNIDLIINYGLCGVPLKKVQRAFPNISRISVINHSVGLNKLTAVDRVKHKGVVVPESKRCLNYEDNLNEWLVKPFYSGGGRGIKIATQRNPMKKKYYQKFISNRRYELRVYSFLWMPIEDWAISKRLGTPDMITWNFQTGGSFRWVKFPNRYQVFKDSKNIAWEVLKILKMGFGAVDLIVDEDLNIYFIEVNCRPGFTDFGLPIYSNAFKFLKEANLSAEEINLICGKES